MLTVTFHIDSRIDLDEAWEILAIDGCKLFYSNEDADGTKEIVGILPSDMSKEELLSRHSCINSITIKELEKIDWNDQWKQHAADYHDGFVHIKLTGPSGEITSLRLQPGPGFGDLSHPTTKIMVQLMTKMTLKDRRVIDIGCGSGILSLAAHVMGASSIFGIDIDEDAIRHSKENAALNNLKIISFLLPEKCCSTLPPGRYVALINMIQSEQEQAWESLQAIHPYIETIIASGILKSGRKEYLKRARQWGWKLIDELAEGEWLGFVFGRRMA